MKNYSNTVAKLYKLAKTKGEDTSLPLAVKHQFGIISTLMELELTTPQDMVNVVKCIDTGCMNMIQHHAGLGETFELSTLVRDLKEITGIHHKPIYSRRAEAWFVNHEESDDLKSEIKALSAGRIDLEKLELTLMGSDSLEFFESYQLLTGWNIPRELEEKLKKFELNKFGNIARRIEFYGRKEYFKNKI